LVGSDRHTNLKGVPMSNYGDQQSRFGSMNARGNAQLIDQGLRSYMLSIYNYMAVGVFLTGLAALVIYSMAVTTPGAENAVQIVGLRLPHDVALTSFGQLIFLSPLKYVLMLAPLAVVFLFSMNINRMEVSTAQIVFWVYSALVGASLSVILLVYTAQSITQAFFVSAAAFAGLSLYGYTTKRSLSAMGSFLMMGLFGIIIAGVVNIFLHSSALQFAISTLGVLIFAGLTAYDTQKLKEQYIYGLNGADSSAVGRVAIMGALNLYLDFLNIFLFLLQFMGQRRD
jgi:FtsH-binding integral membrane protein